MEDVHDEIDVIEQAPSGPAASPSTWCARTPSFFSSSTTCSAIARTCVSEVPLAIRKKSVAFETLSQVEHHDVVGLEIQTQRGGTLHLRE